MGDLKKREQTALEAVARQFSATREKRSDRSDARLVVAGKRVAVDIASLEPRRSGRGNAVPPRLRFDKVANRLLERLRAALGETVPDGMTVLLTITAPIRLPSKTAAALEDEVRALLRRGASSGRDEEATIHGNRVRIRVLTGGSERAPKMIGLVHNPDSDSRLLLDMTRELLELISGKAGRATRQSGERWLVVTGAGGVSHLEAYRHICSQLRMATAFRKILMVFDDGRVGTLAG